MQTNAEVPLDRRVLLAIACPSEKWRRLCRQPLGDQRYVTSSVCIWVAVLPASCGPLPNQKIGAGSLLDRMRANCKSLNNDGHGFVIDVAALKEVVGPNVSGQVRT